MHKNRGAVHEAPRGGKIRTLAENLLAGALVVTPGSPTAGSKRKGSHEAREGRDLQVGVQR